MCAREASIKGAAGNAEFLGGGDIRESARNQFQRVRLGRREFRGPARFAEAVFDGTEATQVIAKRVEQLAGAAADNDEAGTPKGSMHRCCRVIGRDDGRDRNLI